MFEVTIEGLSELETAWNAALSELDAALESSVQDAGDRGIAEFSTNHPYTDRTFALTSSGRVVRVPVVDVTEHAREMRWGGDSYLAPYAPYVDAMPRYNFTHIAIAEARYVLERDAAYSADLFAQRLGT